MKKKLDMLKSKVKIDKNLLVFFIVLLIVGVIVGSIFVTILNGSDKALVSDYLNNFLNNVEGNKFDMFLVFKNNLFNILLFVSAIWLLGISAIGLPVIIIMFFSKSFILGFSIGSILSVYGFKGALFALVYVFPGQVVSIMVCLLLCMYAVSFSMKLIISLIKKKTIDFKHMINKYLIILGITLGITILMVLYDTYLMPMLVKNILPIIR